MKPDIRPPRHLARNGHEFLERHHLPHVAKPFRVEELTEKVRGVLAKASPARSPQPPAKTSAARK